MQRRISGMSLTDLKRWSTQWDKAARSLETVRRRELQAMTDDDVRRAVADLFSVPLPVDLPPRLTSGLVEQQRLFARLRRPA
jgi:hypothetical protein